jgi:hypothetical protein
LVSEARHFLKPVEFSAADSLPVVQQLQSAPVVSESAFAYGHYEVNGLRRVILSDERNVIASSIKRSVNVDVDYESDGIWYRGK